MTPQTPQPRESGHTPGPWFAVDRGIGWMVCREQGNLETQINDHFRETFSEQDARLIAAAPDLLEALRDLIFTASKLWDELPKPIMSGPGLTVTHPTIENAKAVLAKSTGGTP